MKQPKTKAYSYVRMSTNEQLKGDTQRRQHNAIKKYAQENNLELQPPIEDRGISAFQGANADIGKLSIFLKAAEKGEIPEGSFLLMESLDRLSRKEPTDAFKLLQKITGAGVVVVTLADNQKYSSETLRLTPHLMYIAFGSMMRAHDESSIKAQRMKSAWSKKREDIQLGKVTKQRI